MSDYDQLEEIRQQSETLAHNYRLALRDLPKGEGVCQCPKYENHPGECLGPHCTCH